MAAKETKIFDIEGALDRVENDRALYLELVQIFFSDCATNLETLKREVKATNAQAIQEIAHSMKSALGNIGAMSAHATAYELETGGRKGDLSQAGELVVRFESEIAAFKAAVDQFAASA